MILLLIVLMLDLFAINIPNAPIELSVMVSKASCPLPDNMCPHLNGGEGIGNAENPLRKTISISGKPF